MYAIRRVKLEPQILADLRRRQARVDARSHAAGFKAQTEWSKSRQSRCIEKVRSVLAGMTGDHERCMYCVDSHATDIEHFWPKSPYPGRMFCWSNLLLCCTECGRFKGDRFPLGLAGEPLLVDPTVDSPWDHLDLDPETGAITAAYSIESGSWSERGERTVELLQLDRREALQRSYLRTLRRLTEALDQVLDSGTPKSADLVEFLRDRDDHRLLGWLLSPRGACLPAVARLRDHWPSVFEAIVARVAQDGS